MTVPQPSSDSPMEHGRIVVVTDNRIAQAVLGIADVVGRRTTLLGGHEGDEPPLGWLRGHDLDERDAVVLCDHDAPYADAVLREAVESEAGYVAMLASRARAEQVLGTLAESLGEERLTKVHMPAGLDTGGRTPGEIALSVVAEIVAWSHGRAGGPLRDA